MHVGSHEYINKPVLLDDGRVLFPHNKQSEYYNPKTRRFYSISNNGLEIPAYSVAIKLLDGRVLFTGGEVKNKVQPTTLVFNSKTDTFSKGPSMITARKNHSAILLNDGRVFIVGGANKGNKMPYLKFTEFYNPKTNKFEEGPELPAEILCVNNIVRLKNGNNYVFACANGETDYTYTGHIYKFTEGSKAFKHIVELPYKYSNNEDVYKLQSEEIIIFCGMSDIYKNVNKIFIYDPETNNMRSKVLNLPDKFNAKTILLPDDTLLFIGLSTGFATSYKVYKDAKIYNPKTNELKTLNKKLNIRRESILQAVFLKDGNLLITGRDWREPRCSSAEIYMFNNKIEK